MMSIPAVYIFAILAVLIAISLLLIFIQLRSRKKNKLEEVLRFKFKHAIYLLSDWRKNDYEHGCWDTNDFKNNDWYKSDFNTELLKTYYDIHIQEHTKNNLYINTEKLWQKVIRDETERHNSFKLKKRSLFQFAIYLQINSSRNISILVPNLFNHKRKITPAPGNTLLEFSKFIYAKKTYSRVFEPLISDMRDEYYDALNQNRLRKAKWIAIRGNILFVQTIIAHAGVSVVKLARDIFKISS